MLTGATTVDVGDIDVIIVRRYWESKRHASSLNSYTRLIGRISDDSI
jgi:hypothetical protein